MNEATRVQSNNYILTKNVATPSFLLQKLQCSFNFTVIVIEYFRRGRWAVTLDSHTEQLTNLLKKH